MKDFLATVIYAALICTVLSAISPKKSASGKLITMLIGIFFILSLLKPLLRLDYSTLGMTNFPDSNSETFVEDGVNSSSQMLRQVITERTCAYVMEKAASLGMQVSVSIDVTDDTMPVPCSATIQGAVSPYQRERLSYILENELNIPKERQKWI